MSRVQVGGCERRGAECGMEGRRQGRRAVVVGIGLVKLVVLQHSKEKEYHMLSEDRLYYHAPHVVLLRTGYGNYDVALRAGQPDLRDIPRKRDKVGW
jgi:hypothetical protein